MRWLLKPNHDYSDKQAKRIKRWAWKLASSKVRLDENFQKALGLRNVHDVLHIELSMCMGSSFSKALAMALSS